MNRRQVEKILKSMANARRLSILKLLSGRDEATVGEIAEHLKLSFRSTSRHLGNLASAELIERRQVGTAVFSSIVRPLPNFLSMILQNW